jgi:hypothetical protein
MGEAFYGRIKVYGACFSADTDPALVEAISRNIYDSTPRFEAERVTAYTRAAARMLQDQEVATIIDGDISFPEPAAY